MSTKKFVAKKPRNLMTLEEPGKPLLYGADRDLAAEVSGRWNIEALVASLQGKDEKAARAAFEGLGKELMQLTIELADTKYLDRTGEMIERVARQTGISFPHRFQRYVELGIIASRPMDKWNIVKSTTKEMVLQVYGCAVHQAIKDAGLACEGLPCQALCLASFEVARQKTADSLEIQVRKVLTRDGMCEFSFVVRP